MKRGQIPEETSVGNGFNKYSSINLNHPKYKHHMANIRKNKSEYNINSPIHPFPKELREVINENKHKHQ